MTFLIIGVAVLAAVAVFGIAASLRNRDSASAIGQLSGETVKRDRAVTLDTDEAEAMADLLKVLADPIRLRLISLIASSEGAEACACDLTEPLGRSQPTVSHHLKILTEAGLLTREKRGRWAWYAVVDSRLTDLAAALSPQPAETA